MLKIVAGCPICHSPVYAPEAYEPAGYNGPQVPTVHWTCSCQILIQDRMRAETRQIDAETDGMKHGEDWRGDDDEK